jgi:integrase
MKNTFSRYGRGSVAYWKNRLWKNKVHRNKGVYVVPEWYVRLRHEGVTKRVRLSTSDKDRAAEEALTLSRRLSIEGWSVITSKLARTASGPTIDEYCEEYQKAVLSMDNPPRPHSVKEYIRHLKQICNLGDIHNLSGLNLQSIERARDRYRAKARLDNRSEAAIQNSLGIIIRNAAACFSKKARVIMVRNGLDYPNPFIGIPRTQKIEPVAALEQEILLKIWDDLPLLRDGDSNASKPDRKDYVKKYKKSHGGSAPRWIPIDFTKPHPEAYCVILLALGLGLRRNEIDKARWSWIKFDSKGDCILEIKEEEDFQPKGGTNRFVRIPAAVYTELEKARVDLQSPYILGGEAKDNVDKFGYRMRSVLRVATIWLRERGIEAEDKRSNPLHRLRKQFGSEVATTFGLFQAQKLLGHSSPMVTAKYYAAQTNLPELTHVRITG